MNLTKIRNLLINIISSNAFLFILFTVGYMLWRHGSPVVWNDTGLFKAAGVNAYDNNAVKFGLIDTIVIYFNSIKILLPDLFREVSQHGYRPVAQLIHFIFSILAYTKSIYPSWGQLFVVGTVIGSLAVSFKVLASHFIKSKLLIYFALIFFLFSSPLLSSSWILYVGIPALVPLFSALCFILYFKILDNPKNVWIYYILLFAILFFSPWYREFMIMVPITIIVLETIRTFRITTLSLFSFLLFLHALFPTYLTHFVYPQLPVRPFFNLGLVNDQLSVGYIRQEVSRHLFNIPSPSFLIILFIVFLTVTSITIYREKINKGFNLISSWSNLLALFLGVIGLIGVFIANDKWPYHLTLLSFLLIGWSIERRLAIWIILFLAPFYKVFTTQIHLAYVMMPIAILFCVFLEKYWGTLRSGHNIRKFVRYALSVAIVLATLDAFANLVAVRSVMKHISTGIEDVAQKLQEKIADKPVAFISNMLHADDLKLFLKGNYEIYWTIGLGHDRPDRIIDTIELLSNFLKKNLHTKDIYLLDISHDYLGWRGQYFQHKFVANAAINTEKQDLLHRTSAEYFMPDPLRQFGNRGFFSFLGPPDLENDFYRGPSSRPFFRKVEAEYSLYRVLPKGLY